MEKLSKRLKSIADEMKSQVELYNMKLRSLQLLADSYIPPPVWNIIFDYVCEDSQMVDLLRMQDKNNWTVYGSTQTPIFNGFFRILEDLSADGFPISFEYWKILPNAEGTDYVPTTLYQGDKALELLLMLPEAFSEIEVENIGNQRGVVIMRKYLYSQLYKLKNRLCQNK